MYNQEEVLAAIKSCDSAKVKELLKTGKRGYEMGSLIHAALDEHDKKHTAQEKKNLVTIINSFSHLSAYNRTIVEVRVYKDKGTLLFISGKGFEEAIKNISTARKADNRQYVKIWKKIIYKYQQLRELAGDVTFSDGIMREIFQVYAIDTKLFKDILSIFKTSMENTIIDLSKLLPWDAVYETKEELLEYILAKGGKLTLPKIDEYYRNLIIGGGGDLFDNEFFKFLVNKLQGITADDQKTLIRILVRCNKPDLIKFYLDKGWGCDNDLLNDLNFFEFASADELGKTLHYLLSLSGELRQEITDDSIIKCSITGHKDLAFESTSELLKKRQDFPESKLLEALMYAMLRSLKKTYELLLTKLKAPGAINVNFITRVAIQTGIGKDALRQYTFQLMQSHETGFPFGLCYDLSKDMEATLSKHIINKIKAVFSQELSDINIVNLIIDSLSEIEEIEKGRHNYGVDVAQGIILAIREYYYNKEKRSIHDCLSYSFGSFRNAWVNVLGNDGNDLKAYSLYGFNSGVYRELVTKLITDYTLEDNSELKVNAYKLTVLFGSEKKAVDYLKNYKMQHPSCKQPAHDACLFELPKFGMWDIKSWRKKIVDHQYSPKLIQLLPQAVEIEASIDTKHTPLKYMPSNIRPKRNNYWKEICVNLGYKNIPKTAKNLPEGISWEDFSKKFREMYPLEWKDYEKKKIEAEYDLTVLIDCFIKRRTVEGYSYNELLEIIVKKVYGEVEEAYIDIAYDCAQHGLTKEQFNELIELHKKPRPYDLLPNIKLENQEGYVFEKMQSNDIEIMLAGAKTGCCQHLGGAGASCARHAFMHPCGGIYRIMKDDKWVAQSWGVLTRDGELLFDSIEWNTAYNQKEIIELYKKAADEILRNNSDINRVVVGGGGNTPKNLKFPIQASPQNGYSRGIGWSSKTYSDASHSRYIIAKQETPELKMRLVDGQGVDTIVKVGNKRQDYLTLHPIDRINFFASHSELLKRLNAHKQNPLHEEGYYLSPNDRQHIGEHFIPFEMAKEILKKKIKNKCVLCIDNNNNYLIKEITSFREHVLPIYYVDRVHAQAAYIVADGNSYNCLIVDSENDAISNSDLCNAIKTNLPNAKIVCTTARLQKDYFSCSTFAIKALSTLSKYHSEIFQQCGFDDISPGELKLLAPETTPARLLKMSQSEIKVSEEALGRQVNKQQTLGDYWEKYRTAEGKNSAALLKKYRFLRKIELTPQR